MALRLQRDQFEQPVRELGWPFLYNVTEPVLNPLRRILPNLGGIDISPIVVLLIIFFIQAVLHNTVYPALLQLTM